RPTLEKWPDRRTRRSNRRRSPRSGDRRCLTSKRAEIRRCRYTRRRRGGRHCWSDAARGTLDPHRHPALTMLRLAPVVLGVLAWSTLAAQEEAPDPHAAQPERPTVATHAGTVFPGWVEIEAGAQRSETADALAVQTPLVVKFGAVSHVQISAYLNWQAQNG